MVCKGVMGIKAAGKLKLRCPPSVAAAARSRLTPWMLRATTTVLLWTCVVQLTAVGNTWGPRVLKGWPSCRTAREAAAAAAVTTTRLAMPEPVVEKAALPPKRIYRNNGYLMVSCNGGLNQMRAAICDMVVIARYLNVTLIVPELDKTSFWNDPSEFQDIFDIENFITSLRDEVRILRELPPRIKRRVELGKFHSMPPISWSDISYYHKQILPLIQKYKVLHLNRTDARLANNGCTPKEAEELTRMRYMGFKKTILLDRKLIVELVDQYTSGSLRWDEFSSLIKAVHANRMGSATTRTVIPDRPKEEDYFYANPQECLRDPNMFQTL
nr:unnamed protein product [Digitaria exilis]